jgi:hypothetical protein
MEAAMINDVIFEAIIVQIILYSLAIFIDIP